MSPRRRKRALIPLQAASSRLGQWGRDSRFYGGMKWTRRQRAKLKARATTTPPLQFNVIKPTRSKAQRKHDWQEFLDELFYKAATGQLS